MKVFILQKKLDFFKYISLILVLILVLSIFISNTNALITFNKIGSEEKKIDTLTYNSYDKLINENNTGKVWADKSVFNNDITIDNNTIKKETDEEFLVSLSALSLGVDLNLKEGNVKDIVIVQDASDSMKDNKVGSITRLQASKNAINELLETIAKANDNLSSDEEKFKLAVVTFNTKGSEKVIFDLSEVNTTNLSELQTKVNGITTKLDTYISTGLNLAYEQIETNGRPNVDSSIITFMDGKPGPASDGQVAITEANNIKKNDIVMYSVIMNNDATGGTSTDIDKIGQALSSNYENATSTSDLGEKTGNTYYYIPKTADDLIDAFKDIIRTILKKVYTLERGSNLTFKDQLGEYMEVKKVKALYYNNVMYTKVDETINGNVTSYTFSSEVADSSKITTNLNTIKINVTKSNNIVEGDTISVSIPYNLIPLVIYNVESKFQTDKTVYTTTLEEAKPITLVYSSNVKSEVFNLYRSGDSGILEYINKHGTVNNYSGKALFYSNLYKEGVNGTTEVSYKPFSRNNYYYYEDESYLYTKSNGIYSLYTGNELVNGSYYIKKIIYNEGKDKERVEVYEEVKSVKEAIKDSENHWYFSDTTKKDISTIEVKEENITNTATNVNTTNWNNNEVRTLLGNNGVTEVEMDLERINIKVNKIWEDSNNESGGRPKSIKIKLKRNGQDLGSNYEVELSEENNWSYTYLNLPLSIDGKEMKYSIEEEKLDNYIVKIEGSPEEGFRITNTIIIENPYTGFKTAIIVIVLSIILIYICYYFRDKRNRLYKI